MREYTDMTLEQVEKAVGVWATFVKAHHTALIIALGALLTYHIAGQVHEAWDKHEDRLATAADVQAKTAQDQLALAIKANADLSAKLDAVMKQRAQVTIVQKQTDDTMSASDLSKRLQTLVNAGHIQVDTAPSALPDTLTLDSQAAHKVADDEEDLVQLRQDVPDLKAQLASCVDTSAKKDMALTTEKTAHEQDVKAEKAKAHGAWLRGFKWGVITGVTLGLVIHK